MPTRQSPAIALAVGIVFGVGVAPAAEWPQFLGPTRDGVAPEAPTPAWPDDGPPLLWRVEVGQGFSGPVVRDGQLVLFHRVRNQERISCLNPATGEERWSHEYRTAYVDDFGFDEGPRATPLIEDGSVYTLGAAGDLTALRLADGEKIWSRNLTADYRASKGFFGFACSPMIAGGHLLINVGADGAGVVAFDPATGEEVWRKTDDGASYSSPVSAVIGGRPHAVFFTRRGLLGLDPKDGSVRFEKYWRARLAASVNAATPLVRGDEIFLSSNYQTGAVLLRVGERGSLAEVWANDESLSNHYNTGVVREGFIYGIHGRQEYGTELRCVEWATGKVRWAERDFGCASLILTGDHILALTENGDLVRFRAEPAKYTEEARARVLDKPVRAAAALAGGRLYARDEKRLIGLRLDGRP